MKQTVTKTKTVTRTVVKDSPFPWAQEPWQLVMMNDNVTVLDAVYAMLRDCIGMKRKEIKRAVSEAEENGEAVVKELLSRQVCMALKQRCMEYIQDYSKKNGFPCAFKMRIRQGGGSYED